MGPKVSRKHHLELSAAGRNFDTSSTVARLSLQAPPMSEIVAALAAQEAATAPELVLRSASVRSTAELLVNVRAGPAVAAPTASELGDAAPDAAAAAAVKDGVDEATCTPDTASTLPDGELCDNKEHSPSPTAKKQLTMLNA